MLRGEAHFHNACKVSVIDILFLATAKGFGFGRQGFSDGGLPLLLELTVLLFFGLFADRQGLEVVCKRERERRETTVIRHAAPFFPPGTHGQLA